jgi:hypothetical protein
MLKKLIHIDNFFTQDDAEKLLNVSYTLRFENNDFGKEVLNFNLVDPELGPIFNKILGEEVEVIDERSGVFRQPVTFIHFEDFESIHDWIFVVALEQTTFNTYFNLNGPKTALEGYKLGYRNLFEWEVKNNIILYPNECLFFRPWLFHSFDRGLVQIYRLRGKNGVQV